MAADRPLTRRPFDDDRVILELAAPQHGVVSSRQLREAGVGRGAIARRLRADMLRRVYHGVYRAGPVALPHSKAMATVLACDGRATLSHRTAVSLWEVTPPQLATYPVDVIGADSDHGRRRSSISFRRARALRPDEITSLYGMPVTTIERTLMDLAGVAGHRELERALAGAYVRKLTGRTAIGQLLGRHAGEPGVAKLRALIDGPPPAFTESEAEEVLLGHSRRFGLPEPKLNVTVCGYRVDFYWPDHRFIVEVDGYAFHSSSQRFEGDRLRDAVLAAAGIAVMRVTWRQLTEDTDRTIVRLALALGARST